MTWSTFGEALREQRNKAGLSQRELGKLSGINYVTIANIEAGRTKNCNANTREKLEAVIGKIEFDNSLQIGRPPETYLRKTSHKNRMVPLVGKIPAGDPRVVDIGDGQTVDVPELLLPDDEVCAVIVSGISMHPSYEPGDIVVLRQAEWKTVKNHQVCAVTLDRGETTLKEVEFRGSEEAPEVWIIPHNREERAFNGELMFQPERIDPDACRVEGVVVGLMSKIAD